MSIERRNGGNPSVDCRTDGTMYQNDLPAHPGCNGLHFLQLSGKGRDFRFEKWRELHALWQLFVKKMWKSSMCNEMKYRNNYVNVAHFLSQPYAFMACSFFIICMFRREFYFLAVFFWTSYSAWDKKSSVVKVCFGLIWRVWLCVPAVHDYARL